MASRSHKPVVGLPATGSNCDAGSLPLTLVTVVFVLLCVASLATNLVLANSPLMPSAYPPLDALQSYYTGARDAVRLSAFFQGGEIMVAPLFRRQLRRGMPAGSRDFAQHYDVDRPPRRHRTICLISGPDARMSETTQTN